MALEACPQRKPGHRGDAVTGARQPAAYLPSVVRLRALRASGTTTGRAAGARRKTLAIALAAAKAALAGNPVQAVAAPEELSRRLSAAGLSHQLLSARQELSPTETVERAGQRGRTSGALRQHDIRISMDGKGRWLDNTFVERPWRSVKYEEVYLKVYDSIGRCRPHPNGQVL